MANKMTNNDKMKEQGYFSIREIIYLVIRALGVDFDKLKQFNGSSKEITSLKKPVERFFADKGIQGKKEGNTYYYSKSDVYNLITDKDTYELLKKDICDKLHKICSLKMDDNNNFEKIRTQAIELDNNTNEIKKTYEDLGLTNENIKEILLSKMNGGDLLDVYEMQFLNKNKDKNSQYKGLVHRSDLDEDEIYELDWYNEAMLEFEAEEKEIERRFKEKILEIKINYLFEKYCSNVTIDEELLRNDISNDVRGGAYDSDVNTFRLYSVNDKGFNIDEADIEDIDNFDVDIHESRLRLKNSSCTSPYITKNN